jgi:hypothetical protein
MATVKTNFATISTSLFAIAGTTLLGVQIATALVAPIL